jgi:DNA sulfur modification protein DndB
MDSALLTKWPLNNYNAFLRYSFRDLGFSPAACTSSKGDRELPARGFFTLPAIRGIQATREYYVVMVRIRQIDSFNWLHPDSIPRPELRAQRVLTKSRIPAIRDYIVQNPTEYVLPALTLTVDSYVSFEPASSKPGFNNIGLLKIPRQARFLINDGQHRLAGIQAALCLYPDLANETISSVIFVDAGLRQAQRVFVALNKHAVRPSRSLCILYDFNNPLADLTRRVAASVPILGRLTDLERSTLPRGSTKLFTLNSLYRATAELLHGIDMRNISDSGATRTITFWQEVCSAISEWEAVDKGETPAVVARQRYVHSCTLGLIGIGRAGHALLQQHPGGWVERVRDLGNIDWNRSSHKLWAGRATTGGKLTASRENEVLVGNLIKLALGLTLASDEQHTEDQFRKARELLAAREGSFSKYAD